jgi:hypothetical protein
MEIPTTTFEEALEAAFFLVTCHMLTRFVLVGVVAERWHLTVDEARA